MQYKLVHTYAQETYYCDSLLEIFICIYSVRGEIDQISTNTFIYTMCSAPNVYMFVYILIIAPIVPLRILQLTQNDCSLLNMVSIVYNILLHSINTMRDCANKDEKPLALDEKQLAFS